MPSPQLNARWLPVGLGVALVVLLMWLVRLTERKLNVADDIAARLESVRGQMVRDDQWITQSILDVDRERRRAIRRYGNDSDGEDDLWLSSVEQRRRRSVIRQVCLSNQVSRTATEYVAVAPGQDQTLAKGWPRQFLADDVFTHTLYCYNHKAASSTWMTVFANLHPDPGIWDAIERKTYRISKYMSPKSGGELLNRLDSGFYFSFTVVRHPFDRLLSAFRDRILDGCTYQAKQYVPRIFRKLDLPKQDDLFGWDGCVKRFPTFAHFLQFVSDGDQRDADSHWSPYAQACSPCLVEYDAIVKLETAEQDQMYVMRRSGMEQHVRLEAVTWGQSASVGSSSTDEVRREFYGQVSCRLLERVRTHYALDFDLFEYDPKPFMELCSAE